jgi:mRNA interferase MazF
VVNQRRRTVVVVPLSFSPLASPPVLTPLDCNGQPAVAVVDQIRAVSKQRLDRQMGTLSPEHLEAVENALRQILEL